VKVVTVIGNRPQFVKAAAVSRLLREQHEELLVHTGQHYDDELSTVFVEELGIPRPELELGIGGGSNTEQTARMLAALAPLLEREAPDALLVYGDTNSTLAGGLAAAQRRIPVAHVEAGMRSFDRRMPEELNRVLTDHLSDLLLCPSRAAVANLEREAVVGRVELVGDVMVDVVWIEQRDEHVDVEQRDPGHASSLSSLTSRIVGFRLPAVRRGRSGTPFRRRWLPEGERPFRASSDTTWPAVLPCKVPSSFAA